MQLAITTTFPRIQIETRWPQLEIKQQIAQVQIESSGPEIEIDQRQSRNEIGNGSYHELSRKVRERNYQKVLEAIAAFSQEGDRILAEAGMFQERMIFADLYAEKMAEEIPEINVEAVPRTRPHMQFHYEMNISWAEGGAEIRYEGHPPKITWEMGVVHIRPEKASKKGWIG